MNEQQARAIDVGIRAICGATHSVSKEEAAFLLRARRTLERMLAEGFVPCKKCGRLPTPYAMLVESDGWCAICHCGLYGRAYGKTLDDVREEWNKEARE